MLTAKHVTSVNGLHVTYYSLGNGEPLLFLHGGRVRAKTFKPLLLLLSKKYTVIAPDIPGFGSSDTPQQAWSFAEYGAFFDTFLEQLNIQNATVMGYSMGGGIAANLAAASKRVTKLVLIDASGIHRPKEQRSHHDGQRLWFYLRHPQHVAAFGRLLRDYAQYAWKHRSDYRHMRAIRRACFDALYDDNLRRIVQPTALIWGKDDWIYPIATARAFQEHIPQAKLKIVQGNHDWLVYAPLLIRQHVL